LIDSLKLSDAHATAIIEKAIEFDVYEGDEVPDNKKDRLEAAHEIVAFGIESWTNDGVTPDADDEDIAEAGKQIAEIFEIAGIEVDDDGEVTYGDPGDLDGDDDDDDESDDDDEDEDESDDDDEDDDKDDEDDDEAAFDIDDIIEGYDGMSAKDIIAALREGVESDDIDDDDLRMVKEYEEEERDKPRSRILNAIDELLEEFDGESDDDDDDDNDASEDDDEDDEDEEDEDEDEEPDEPWEGYNKASAKEVKDALEAAKEDDDEPLNEEQVQYVLEYEQANKGRKRIIDWCNDFLASSDDDDEDDSDDDDDDDDEGVDLDTLDRKALKALIKENDLDIKVTNKMDEDDIRQAIREAVGDDDDDESEDEPEEEAEEEAEEEKPAKSKGKAKGRGSKKGKDADKELDDDMDRAVAKDDEADDRKGKKKGKKKADSSGDYSDDEIEGMLPAGLARVFVKSKIDDARKEIEERGLAVPESYEGEMPELPDNISSLSHDELSDLLAQFQNALSTAITAQSEHYVWQSTYEEIADHLENQALLESDQSNDTKRKAEARTDERVVFFRAKQKHHYGRYVRWRDLARTIEGKARVVSRVGGFIEGEHDTEDRVAAKGSTKGKAKGASKKRKKS
jgi:hypothetical protein